jgi:nitrogen regulatory protein P-II 1
MKAYIRPERLNNLVEHLKNEKYCCFTVFEGEGVED